MTIISDIFLFLLIGYLYLRFLQIINKYFGFVPSLWISRFVLIMLLIPAVVDKHADVFDWIIVGCLVYNLILFNPWNMPSEDAIKTLEE